MKTSTMTRLLAVSFALLVSSATWTDPARAAVTNAAPTLVGPASVTTNEGVISNALITGSDPDGDCLTFSKVSGPTFMTVTTTSCTTGNVGLAPGFLDAGTYPATVRATDTGGLFGDLSFTITVNNVNQRSAITAPATASGVENIPIATITATATDADAADNLTITQAGKPASLTFTAQAAGPSPRTAQITGTPASGSEGTYTIVWTVNDGTGATNATASTTTFLTIVCSGRPAITAPATAGGTEGIPIATITATATDACNRNLTITQTGKPASLTFTAQAAGPSPRTATITGTPAFGSAGTYNIVWTVNDGTGTINSTASTTTVLTITRGVNRCPTANPGGPYLAMVGVPLTFDGTGSSDPDGDPLTYAWDFDASDGITVNATGPNPVHVYSTSGTFTVTLSVTDNGNGDPTQACSDTATSTATLAEFCTTVISGYDPIKLASGRPLWFAYVEPVGGCYANSDVVLSSFVLKYAGNQIPATARKTFAGGDKNGDGIEEIRVSFAKADLRTLFAGLPNGHNLVEVAIEANLATGGILHGTTLVDVLSSGTTSAALISPNPMNPTATLTFTTTRPGSAKVEMFDIGGRLVRTILDERSLAAGVHDVKIEGHGRRGESLASGIYFIRGVSADGEFKQTIAILK